MSAALTKLTQNMASRFDLDSNADELIDTLKATAFREKVTDAQMTALMLVAQQYNLNPWTRELYAFPDKNGIIPVVGLDGWARIINSNPQFDGMEFEQDDKSCTCFIYRKDRGHPTKITEYLNECKRNTGPWQSHPKRMLRHKAMIQCARIAFGFTGIYDPDEAERIIESKSQESQRRPASTPQVVPFTDKRPACTTEKFEEMCIDVINAETGEIEKMGWKSLVQSGTKTAEHLIKNLSKKYRFTDEQLNTIESWET